MPTLKRKICFFELFFILFIYFSSAYWNSSWNFRQPIALSSSENLTNFQVQISLNSSNVGENFNWSSDESSIRFTYFNSSSGTEEKIPYWVEYWNSNYKNASIWVKAPSLSSASSTTLYMYYGNPSSSSESNGSAVFEFFDNGDSLNNWYNWSSGNVYLSDFSYAQNHSIRKDTNCHPSGGYKNMSISLDRNGWVVEFLRYRKSGDGTDCYWDRTGVGDENGNGYNIDFGHGSTPYIAIDKMTGTTTTVLGQTQLSSDLLSQWYVAQLIFTPTEVTAKLLKLDGSVVGETTSSDITYSSFSHVFVEGGRPYYVGVVKVRKYSSPPSIALGSEQDPQAPQLSFVSPTNGKYTNSTSAIINASIDEAHLDNLIFNWDGKNYSLYDNSLISKFNFNNNSEVGDSPSVAADISKYKNNGAIYGAVYSEGKFGNALQFDGANDYVSLSNLAVNTSAGAHNTVEFWMYWDGKEGKMPFGWKSPYDLWFQGGCFGFNTGQGNVYGINDSNLSNKWLHVVAVFYNGVPSNSTASLYINGVKQNIFPCYKTTSASRSVTSDAHISGWAYGGGYYFGGKIDELSIYNRALNEDEIMAHYYSNFRKHNSSESYFNSNKTNLSDGDYSYYLWANDSASNQAMSSRSLHIDTIPPSISILSPASHSTASNPISVNLTTTDSNLDFSNLSLYNSAGDLANSTKVVQNGNYIVEMSAPEGDTYSLFVTSFDKAGNRNSQTVSDIYISSPSYHSSSSTSCSTFSVSTLISDGNVTLIAVKHKAPIEALNVKVYNSDGDIVGQGETDENGEASFALTSGSYYAYLQNDKYCKKKVRFGVNTVPPECAFDSDCADSETCSNGRCISLNCENSYAINHTCVVLGCVKNSDCNSGEVCKEHACVALPQLELSSPSFVKFGENFKVRVLADGLPISNAAVKLDGVTYYTKDGEVQIRATKPGQYLLKAEKDGYKDAQKVINIGPLEYSAPPKIISEKYAANTGDVVSLKLVDSYGNPLPNREIEVIFPNGGKQTITTNENGEFSVQSKLAGRVKVLLKDNVSPVSALIYFSPKKLSLSSNIFDFSLYHWLLVLAVTIAALGYLYRDDLNYAIRKYKYEHF